MATLPFRRGRALTPNLLDSPGSTNPTGSDADETSLDTSASRTSRRDHEIESTLESLPILSHRLRHDSSILVTVLSDTHIYAGTQAGEIVVYALDTYEKTAVIQGHAGSVLSLTLSRDNKLLFSGAGDRILNVWNTNDLSRSCCIYSSFDVGDIFCVAWSNALQTVYLGAQNTTIQWCSPKSEVLRSGQKRHVHPSLRDDKFFDSAGPGGVRTPRPPRENVAAKHAVGGEELMIGNTNVKHFAHYGYVLCMVLVKDGVPEAQGGEVLITGGGDGVVKVWTLDAKNDGAIKQLFVLDDGREEGHSVHAMAIDGTFLYTTRSGGEVDVWDLETRQLVRNLKAHRDDVMTICVGGGFIFSASVTGYVRKFDRQYALRSRLKAHEGRILSSAFTYHKDRPVYVTGGSDNTIAVWDVSDCIGARAAPAKSSDELLIEYLRRFISYRTVSSDSRYQVDCRRGASFLRAVFKNFGASTEMLLTSSSYNPVILARFRGNPTTREKRKTILFYGHYDVVAADNSGEKWMADPFTMEGIDGYLYGRGTSDNKGPIMAAIFACAELTREQNLGSDIVFLIEGEEETGSRGFEQAIKANKDKIGDIDWILLANSYWLDDRIPCLTYGLRGVIHATVQIDSSHPDLHSGVDGSAQLDEPLKDLVMLLSTLTGRNGKVEIPGFYDPIPDLSREEVELYSEITSALVQRNPSLGDRDTLAASLMRRWREASLTIHRFQTSGPDNATIIPRLAKVALSMRLVPNQTTAEITEALQAYLHTEFDKLDSKNRLTVTVDHRAEPWLGDWTNEIFKTLEEAIMEAWGPIDLDRRRSSGRPPRFTLPTHERVNSEPKGARAKSSPTTSAVLANGSATPPKQQPALAEVDSKLTEVALSQKTRHSKNKSTSDPVTTPSKSCRKPLYIREGGSIPAIRFLEKEFGAPAAHFPCGQASDSAHLNNERLRLLNLYKSRDIFKRVFQDLPQR